MAQGPEWEGWPWPRGSRSKGGGSWPRAWDWCKVQSCPGHPRNGSQSKGGGLALPWGVSSLRGEHTPAWGVVSRVRSTALSWRGAHSEGRAQLCPGVEVPGLWEEAKPCPRGNPV